MLVLHLRKCSSCSQSPAMTNNQKHVHVSVPRLLDPDGSFRRSVRCLLQGCWAMIALRLIVLMYDTVEK